MDADPLVVPPVLEANAVELELERQRGKIEAWLNAVYYLSVDLQAMTAEALLEGWVASMVDDLGFQMAGAYECLSQGHEMVVRHGRAPFELPKTMHCDAVTFGFLSGRQSGWFAHAEPAELGSFAQTLGLGDFFWFSVPTRSMRLLLLAGFSSECEDHPLMQECDLNHFALVGANLAALLDNIALIAELDRERLELQQSNQQLDSRTRELEEANVQLRNETSERLLLEKSLREAQKLQALGRLAACIGHEINNPLTYVLTNLESAIVDLRRSDPATLKTNLDGICDALSEAVAGAHRIGKIVRSTRVFARPCEAPPSAVDVHGSLDSASQMVLNELRHRARLVHSYGEVPTVISDPHRLEQVFVNLLLNAIQALPSESNSEQEVRITTSFDPTGMVAVEISDTGLGIAPDNLEHVFDPFFSTRPVGQGTGLGLWICKSIVEGFGGRISIESRPGIGTKVTVRLVAAVPGCAPEPRPSQAPPALAIASERRALRLLLIDDDPPVLRGLQRALRAYHTRATQDGREALALYRAEPYDLVFCDVMMPGFGGREFYTELAKMGPEHARRVVFMTGGVFTDPMREFLTRIDNPCISKPFESRELERLIEQQLVFAPEPPAQAAG